MDSNSTGPAGASLGLPDAEELGLVTRLKAREAAAYELVVRAHSARLLAVATRLLRNPEDARDAVQEGFLSAFRAIDSFSGSSRISTWLHRIVVNCALMKIRSRKRCQEESIESLLPAFHDDGHRVDPTPAWQESCHAAVELNERCALVRRLIDELPETHRTVLLLRDIEEMDTREVADALRITENAVKIRLHRARQALRALLDPHFSRGIPS